MGSALNALFVNRPDILSGSVPRIVVLRRLLLALRRHLRGIWSAGHASRSQFFALTVIFGFRRLTSVQLLFSVHDALLPPDALEIFEFSFAAIYVTRRSLVAVRTVLPRLLSTALPFQVWSKPTPPLRQRLSDLDDGA
jgi:hypothetical protein